MRSRPDARRWLRMLAALCGLAGLLAGCSPAAPAPQAGDPCDELADCVGAAELACQGGTCQAIPCERSRECPVGAACVRGQCTAPECASDGDCAEQGRCFEGACRDDLCQDRSECPDGQVCLGRPPLCQEPPEVCESDVQCPRGQGCKLPASQCVTLCGQGQRCPDQGWCDGLLCRSICQLNAQCDLGERCVEGRCQVPRDCSSEPPCPGDRPLRDPVDCSCVACLEDVDCAVERQEACDAGECIVCELRAADEGVCADVDLARRGGCCVECVEDVDCEAGELCERAVCVDLLDRSCLTDVDCRQDRICDGGRCTRPASLAPCQLQRECPDGEACYADGRCRVEGNVCQGCRAPGRCVAEAGDRVGTCAGCREACAQDGCPDDQLCFVPEGDEEGWCVAASFSGCGS